MRTYQLIMSRSLCIGFCGECVLHQDMPGSYHRSSAYHCDGSLRWDNHWTSPFNSSWNISGKKYGKGDIIGCGIDWGNSLFFLTLNGKLLGELLWFVAR
jgi:hypothetical protein